MLVVFWLGGVGRVISYFAVGAPHPLFSVLMWIEIALPIALLALSYRSKAASAWVTGTGEIVPSGPGTSERLLLSEAASRHNTVSRGGLALAAIVGRARFSQFRTSFGTRV
jgi:hypothetical protein